MVSPSFEESITRNPSHLQTSGHSKITWHDFRHQTASTLAQKGASLTNIQKILGHERATTTDHYLQSLGESVREAMGLLEGVFTESTTPVTTEVVTTGAPET